MKINFVSQRKFKAILAHTQDVTVPHSTSVTVRPLSRVRSPMTIYV